MIECIDMALSELKKTDHPEEKICSSSAYWIPLQWLYVRMIENKDLVPISSLPMHEKNKALENSNISQAGEKGGMGAGHDGSGFIRF